MSTYEISKSSLLSLKAEILRKQEELSKAKAENEVKIKNLKKNFPLDLKNKGVELRVEQDLNEEDEDLLEKSRDALEAKSKLYEKLSKGALKLTSAQEEHYRRYLVRFDKKSRVPDLPPTETEDDIDRYPSEEEEIYSNYDPPKSRDEEWVEYVDCLGRTRTCLRKDLEYLKSKDKDLKSTVDRRNRDKSRSTSPGPRPPEKDEKKVIEETEITEENELLSSDMRREILRKQWEKEEEELKNKKDIHYQDILFNEARTHGVGYYGFSKDSEERAKQQEALKKLREETEKQQKKAQDMKAMRERQLKARIRAAKNRKRERLGLPPLEEDEVEVEKEETGEKEEKDEEIDEKEKKREEKRKKHVRPWDLGKEGVKEHYEYSQEEWVDKKRRERNEEFAPPQSYKDSNSSSRNRHQREKRRRSVGNSESEDDGRKNKHDKGRSKEGNKDFTPVPIANELSDSEEDSLLADYRIVDDSNYRGRGVEIAPPPTSDYYGRSSTKRTRRDSDASNVSESIEAGLKFLREQMEKKQTSTKNNIFMS